VTAQSFVTETLEPRSVNGIAAQRYDGPTF